GLFIDPNRPPRARRAPRGVAAVLRSHRRPARGNPAMAKAGVISDYLESLTTALSFDRVLARSVRQEVEDHLWEAIAADRTGDGLEAERRAIANFGDPLAIAAQFAVVSLAQQTRRAGIALILVIGGVFATMKARLAWYAMTEWAMRDDLKGVGATVG